MLLNVVFSILTANYATAANILGIFPMPGYSHYTLNAKLMKGLAEAGHNVTMVSPYVLKDRPKNGRFTDVVLNELSEDYQMNFSKVNLFETETMSLLEKIQFLTHNFLENVNKTLHHSKIKKLIEAGQKFDAVIIEQFSNDALKVFFFIFDCPLIILASNGPHGGVNPTVGNLQPVSYVPNLLCRGLLTEKSFINRTKNLIINILDFLTTKYYAHPKQAEIMHQAFPNAPPLYNLYTNVSLVLLNSHTSTFGAVPLVPNMVEIGGYFIDPPQKLPQDLQEFLDKAKDGVIYFSMGSVLKSNVMSDKKIQAVINVFGKIKQKVLWKFEGDLPNKPTNVMIRKWFPQQDILAHPNIKLFITHGGLLSTSETVYHGVPVLAIPVYSDQSINAEKAVQSGFGLKLEYHDPNFSEEKLSLLINELLNNPKYKENANRRSKIFHDRPQKPMETAVYWVEYVIRHKGAPHLRVYGVRMPWYKYFMVDVLAVLLLGVFTILYGIKLIFKKLCCRSKKVEKSSKKIKTK